MTTARSELYHVLKKCIEGDVYFDKTSQQIYSVDASLYEVLPLGIVAPKNDGDIAKIVTIAKAFSIPIAPRGAGTGLAGACLTHGLVIDTAKYLNQILKVDKEKGYCVCEPGVVQDTLNKHLAPIGMRLGPDTSTGNRATLGGMLGANSAGARSLFFGSMADHVLEVELVLIDGSIITLGEVDNATFAEKCKLEGREGEIYRAVDLIRREHRDEIERRYPHLRRRVSGYGLDALLSESSVNMAKLVAGSEGSFGIATRITLKIVPIPPFTGMCLIHTDDMIATLRAIPEILATNPLSVELIDDHIIALGRTSPSMKGMLSWLEGEPKAVIAVEFQGASHHELMDKLEAFATQAATSLWGYSIKTLSDSKEINKVWALRKAGVGLLLSRRSYSRAVAFIEDLTVTPENVAPFIEELQQHLSDHGKQAGIYGHVGAGCMHIRPFLDLRHSSEVSLMGKIMNHAAQMVIRYGGVMSGEHGDGLIRSWLNRTLFGDEIYDCFVMLKQAFDPVNRMNPGKVVNGPPPTDDLRLDPTTPISDIHTFLDFSKEGGFELSVDMCNGNGECRKGSGLMCPSFQATGDERDTTRARAQALRAIIHKGMPVTTLSDKGLHEVLDLCLECKGCKKECPSNIDMAKMKSEVLYHYHKKHGIPWRDRLFAHTAAVSALASAHAPLANRLQEHPLVKRLLKWIGIATERALPRLALERFSLSLAKREKLTAAIAGTAAAQKRVVLFNDTYTEHYCPHIGHAAYDLLIEMGWQVVVPPWRCCGRPLLSKGFLPHAKKKALNVIKELFPYAKEGLTIVGLEPSCLSAIKDDYPSLLPQLEEEVALVAAACLTIDEFLDKERHHHRLNIGAMPGPQPILYHGHCHQKALVGTAPSLNVLRSVKGFEVTEIPSGCCGMAGSFGYEEKHREISLAIAELHLLPAIRAAPDNAIIVASGFSCRAQITHLLGITPLHLVEALRLPRRLADGS